MATEKRAMSVQMALEWAFRNECAQLDLPPREDDERGGGFGMEYVMIQQAKLGVRVDTSGGGEPSVHMDAESIAAIVATLLPEFGGMGMAIRLVELARSGLQPDWMPGAVPKIVPVAWRGVDRNEMAKSEIIAAYYEQFTVPHPKNPRIRLNRRRRVDIEYTPCRWDPSKGQIENVRAGYSSWWAALDEVRGNLIAGNFLHTIEITAAMPPKDPWKRVQRSSSNSGG